MPEDKDTQSASAHSTDTHWWRGAVIYQIYPRSFQDASGDGIGDLKGITQRLDYVADLGVDAIWLSPFFASPMKDMGYDVSDYRAVDPVFGDLADFDALVDKAHALGVRVIIDQVLSHSSDQHPWFVESCQSKDNPKADWYVWAEARPDGTPPTNWQSVFSGSAWTWNAKRRQYYLHNFLSSQPDLNFHTLAVQDALLDSMRFWLDRGVDGFRLDTVNYYFHDQQLRDNPPAARMADDLSVINPYGFQDHQFDKTRPENISFLKRLRALLNAYPNTMAVGEVGEGDGDRSLQIMVEYTADGDRLQMCYSFDMLGETFTPAHFRDCIVNFDAASRTHGGGKSWPCWAFSNHDVPRHITRWGGPAEDPAQLAKLAAGLLLSLRGSVCLYQGEELGLPEAALEFEDLTDPFGIAFWPEFKGRDGCRTPMVWDGSAPNAGFSSAPKPWLPVKAPHVALAAREQSGRPDSVLEHYRRFLAFRKTRRSLVTGQITFLDWADGLAFIRRDGPEATLCVFNLSNAGVTFEAPSEHKALIGHGFAATQKGKTITLDGHQAYFAAL